MHLLLQLLLDNQVLCKGVTPVKRGAVFRDPLSVRPFYPTFLTFKHPFTHLHACPSSFVTDAVKGSFKTDRQKDMNPEPEMDLVFDTTTSSHFYLEVQIIWMESDEKRMLSERKEFD